MIVMMNIILCLTSVDHRTNYKLVKIWITNKNSYLSQVCLAEKKKMSQVGSLLKKSLQNVKNHHHRINEICMLKYFTNFKILFFNFQYFWILLWNVIILSACPQYRPRQECREMQVLIYGVNNLGHVILQCRQFNKHLVCRCLLNGLGSSVV